MKILLLGLVSLPLCAQAADYHCFAKANPDRGFKQDLTVRVSPAAIGGTLTVESGGAVKTLGTVSSLSSLSRNNPDDVPAFELSLGLVSESDVSGLSSNDLGKVTRLQMITVDLPDDQAVVFQMFNDQTQLSGTFMISGLATACLP